MKSKNSRAEGKQMLGGRYTESEVVIAFVGAVGVDLEKVESVFIDRLKGAGYSVNKIGITKDIIPDAEEWALKTKSKGEFKRVTRMMDIGNALCLRSGDNGILALGAAARIHALRKVPGQVLPKNAFVIHSLKRPEEVKYLREIYPRGFYLVGVYADRERRRQHLTSHKQMSSDQAGQLMDRDMNEEKRYGQQIINTFHLSDFFVHLEGNDDKLKNSVWRIVDLMFSHPHCTPAFSEHAMFLAFAASLRSADLSRQVGAVIARGGEILSTGANDCPKAGGGLYWPVFNERDQNICDLPGGRDYMIGEDSNRKVLGSMIDEIANSLSQKTKVPKTRLRAILSKSSIGDLTEFGRVVHAEMEALLSCARKGVSTSGATMYCTTFPCHTCAKHIVAAGIDRVIFIEPYLKSKAIRLHRDSVRIDYNHTSKPEDAKPYQVRFQPFVGVGPRRFLELFSMNLGGTATLKRKNRDGKAIIWEPKKSLLRSQMLPKSYLELEEEAKGAFESFKMRSIKNGRVCPS